MAFYQIKRFCAARKQLAAKRQPGDRMKEKSMQPLTQHGVSNQNSRRTQRSKQHKHKQSNQ